MQDAAIRDMSSLPESTACPVQQPASCVRRYRVVAGIDLSDYADIVIEHALDQAARHDAPELHFVTVCESRHASAEDRRNALLERVNPALEAFNRHARDWRVRFHVRRGRPDVEITELAAEIRADLIVIGRFGLHTPRVRDRNLPNRVLQQASCPTLVVGMPTEADTLQCPMCSAVRDQTEGERWFCAKHTDSREHHVSSMVIWSGGSPS